MKNDCFLESSAFTKRYTKEDGSDFIDSLFLGKSRLFYLSITYCEVIKVFYRLYKYPQHNEHSITKTEFDILISQFSADLLNAERIALTDEIITKTREILNIGYIKSSIDILHLAGFLITKEVFPNLIFITADNDLADLAINFANDVINLNKK